MEEKRQVEVCSNCVHGQWLVYGKVHKLKCKLNDRIVNSQMRGCHFWKGAGDAVSTTECGPV